MSYILMFFRLLLWTLILIGDFAIFSCKVLYKTLFFLTRTLKNLLVTCVSFVFTSINISLKLIEKQTFALKKIGDLTKKYAVKKSRKKVMSVTIFPLPFMTRLKYFFAGIFFSLLFFFLPLLIIIFLQDLPNPKLMTTGQIPQTTKIYDRHGVLLYQIYASQNRTLVPLEDIPKQLQLATIAIEDKDFYSHIGFDITAIIRSALSNLSGENLQGGSTITQQLIKSALLTSETSIERKVKELVLAFWAERIYSKNQILQMYFNQIPYGGTAWGIETASEIYFGKHVKDLDLAKSAFLAGIPRAPTTYSPYGTKPTAWQKRQKEVLYRMADLKYITKAQRDEALNEKLTFLPPQNPIHAPHFVMYLKDLLVKKYGLSMVEKGGLSVTTTLDLKIQEKAQNIVTTEVASDSYLHLTNGATIVTNPKNGDILAMVGSQDFANPLDGNVNIITSLRQPGSSIKVVTYSAALMHGFTAASILDDSPITFSPGGGAPSYAPVNYDGKFHGRIPLRLALANSFNIPAVKTLNQIGIDTMVDLAKKMGISTWKNANNYGLSITLGSAEVMPLDMATLYGVFANGGTRVDINPILKITDYKGEILEEKGTHAGIGELPELQPQQRVLDEGVSFIISDILADKNARALEFGTNSPLVIPNHYVSVKTGTSDNKRDNWTIGYTTSFLTAVWVGNNDNSPMSQSLASGITGAAPIWNKIMTALLEHIPEEKRKIPQDVVTKPCFGKIEYFIKGTENAVSCKFFLSPTPSLFPH